MADFFNKIRSGQTAAAHGVFISDDFVSLMIDGVEILRAKAAGVQVVGGGAFIQGSGVAGGLVYTDLTTTGVNSPFTLSTSHSGSAWSNYGCAAKQYAVLPQIGTNVGMRFEIHNSDTDGFRIGAGAGQQIRIHKSEVNTSNVCTVGAYADSIALSTRLVLTAVTSNLWSGHATGVWSVLE